jgi:sugar/nucleoside kinase (ribokinase family)
MSRLAVVGHCTIDELLRKGVTLKTLPGGSVIHASIAAKEVGADVSVVSKAGVDHWAEFVHLLMSRGVNIDRLHCTHQSSTHFMLDYRGEGRVLRLINKCLPILPTDLSGLEVDGLHLGPVAGEVPFETLSYSLNLADTISADLQGFVREAGEGGWVFEKPLRVESLSGIDILKASERELKVATGLGDLWRAAKFVAQRGPSFVLVTKGAKSVSALLAGLKYQVPVYEPERVIDTTGAGDAFIGAFMAEYLRGEDPLWCVAMSSAAASCAVENLGPLRPGMRREIAERAQHVFNGIKRVS